MSPEYKPLYMQIMEEIKSRIENGLYKNTETIPSESDFAREFAVSISTVRQAVSVLVADGMLTKKQGKGTYIKENKNHLRLLSWLPENAQGQQLLQKIFNMIEQKHGNIEVEVIPTTYMNARRDLEIMISQGNAPDIAHIVSHWTSYFAARGALTELNRANCAEGLSVRSESDLRSGMFNNKIYSLSWGQCPMALLVNTDVLRSCGVDYVSEKMTLGEWEELVKKVNDESSMDVSVYGFTRNEGDADFLRVYQFLNAFGGDLVNDSGAIVFDSPQNIRALQWLSRFVRKYKVFFANAGEIRKKFVENKIAFLHDGPWSYLWLTEMAGGDFKNRFRAILNPVVCPDGKAAEAISRSWNYSHALVVPSQSRFVADAVNVLNDLTVEPEISRYYYEHSGHLPVNTGEVNETFPDIDFYRVYAQQLAGAKNLHADNVLFHKALEFCNDAIGNIFDHGISVENELKEKQHYLELLYQ